MTHPEGHSFWNNIDMKMLSPVHLLHKRQCYYVLFLAKFGI